MINQEFEFAHPSGVVVSRRLAERDLIASLPSVGATRRDMHTGWVWYSLPAFPDGEVQVSMTLAFQAGALTDIQILDSRPEFGTDWGSWSEENERSRVVCVAQWLAGRGWAPGRYPWGEVWAEYDPRSGARSGGVRYA